MIGVVCRLIVEVEGERLSRLSHGKQHKRRRRMRRQTILSAAHTSRSCNALFHSPGISSVYSSHMNRHTIVVKGYASSSKNERFTAVT